MQVDIIVDETFAADPTNYTLNTFLSNLNLSASDNASFIQNDAVFRRVGPSPATDPLLSVHNCCDVLESQRDEMQHSDHT